MQAVACFVLYQVFMLTHVFMIYHITVQVSIFTNAKYPILHFEAGDEENMIPGQRGGPRTLSSNSVTAHYACDKCLIQWHKSRRGVTL